MTRPSASEIAEALREMQRDKELTRAQFQKQRNEEWLARYDRHINVLGWAAVGYDKLAERTGE